jgi:hypothetical protein
VVRKAGFGAITGLQRSNAELRAAVLLLVVLRRALRVARGFGLPLLRGAPNGGAMFLGCFSEEQNNTARCLRS